MSELNENQKSFANNVQFFNENTGNIKDPRVRYEQFAYDLQKLLKGYGFSLDMFPTQVIVEQFDRDSRAGLCLLFLRNKYNLKTRIEVSKNFGEEFGEKVTKELL